MIDGAGEACGPDGEPLPSREEARLREMDHRIKNHLQLLASYARLAARRGMTGEELAQDLAQKLMVIASAHDALYHAEPDAEVDARPFLETLLAAFPPTRHVVELDCAATLRLTARELAPLGMIASEAVANALKHAFPSGADGRVKVRLAEQAGRVQLTVQDNGVGIPPGGGGRRSGVRLIDLLAGELGGVAMSCTTPTGGTEVSIAYPRRAAG